jgi:hypothetical protein
MQVVRSFHVADYIEQMRRYRKGSWIVSVSVPCAERILNRLRELAILNGVYLGPCRCNHTLHSQEAGQLGCQSGS